MADTTRAQYDCFIGTYTRSGKSEGIYQARFVPGAGSFELTGATEFKRNPSFLVIDQSIEKLFAVCEMSNQPGGTVAMFDMIREGTCYRLDLQSSASTSGEGPCHLLFDVTRRRIVAANYQSGSVGVISVDENRGKLEAIQGIQHQGSGPNPARQEGPHAHSITADPTGTRVIVCDLGLDKVIVYEWDRKKLSLVEEPACRASVPAGSGPRHFAFHPNGRFGYVANEMGNSVTAFTYREDDGVLDQFQTTGSLPDGFDGENTTADIHIDTAGERLYISNRGHDSVAVFTIDANDGSLAPLGHIATAGKEPRNFALTPDDRYLFAANQNTDSIAVFDLESAAPSLPTEPVAVVDVPMPVCIQFG